MNWNFFITAYFNSVFGALIAPMYVRYLHKTGKLDDRFHNLLLLFFLPFSFWSYHFLFALGVNSSLPPWKHLFLILLAVAEAFGTKKYIRRLFTIQTFNTGLFLRKGTLAAVYFVVFEILYHLLIFDKESQLSLNLSAFVLTISLSLGISFSALRLLILLSRESSEPRYRNWLYAGAFFIGVALTINPLLITISMIDPQAANLPLNFNSSLIPFSLQAACWVALLLVPDTYGEKVRLREIEKREETERYYHSLFRHNPDGVLALNREGLILQANTSSAGMSGYEEAELVGQSLSALLPGVCLTLPEDVRAATQLQDDTYETWLRKNQGRRSPSG
ncbi:PAS domain-containing protein [Paenibacillus sp. CC-CFT747]|nr:PAS domain-containing protein [Paenibacillus sp. CC-CFT747]